MTPQEREMIYKYCDFLKEKLGVTGRIRLFFYDIPGAIGKHTWVPERKESEIALNPKIDFNHLITTLAHELAHAKQWESGDMEYHGGFKRTYKGIYYDDFRKIPHADRPWEREAYAVQDKVRKMLVL